MLTKVSPGIETITGRKNILINGNFNIWQRGSSFPIATTGIYTADRMFCARASSVGGYTVNQVAGNIGKHALKMQRDQGDTGINKIGLNQYVEKQNTLLIRGKNVVAKVRLKVGADFSGSTVRIHLSQTSDDDTALLKSSNGTLSSNSSDYVPTSDDIVPTTNFIDYEVNLGIIASTTNVICFRIGFTPIGTAGVDDSITVDRIQLEVGETSTNFEYNLYTEDLEKCKRYYVNGSNIPTSVRDPNAGRETSWCQIREVTMRIIPTESYTLSGGTIENATTPTSERIRIQIKSSDAGERTVMGYTADAEI